MNKTEIIKAIEAHRKGECHNCPYEHLYPCLDILCENTVKFINELTEENERLRAENEALAISDVKECEISQMLVYRIRDKHPAVMAVIADTVRKMQDRLKSLLKTDYINGTREHALSVIDQIAKEMVEGV